MFTAMQRQDVGNRLIAAAEATEGVPAGAVVGAAAAGMLDAFAGIDLMLAVAPDLAIGDLRDRWTERMYRDFGAIHHTVDATGIVFLLSDLLTARIAIVPAARFGPRPGEPFRQVFGPTGPQAAAPSGYPDLVGPAWLAALRTRAELHRGNGPSAALALDELRDALIALAGARTGAPPGYLEPADRDRIRATETASRDAGAVAKAFGVAVQILDAELQAVAPAIADAVALPLLEEVAG
ncbi:hypothetical protein [Tsukamurella ocularis]|uniref:hypothetical protein n=1 Tax=Tsukamurella ocularis TaxID=1970234 RepID=UPI00216A4A0F|nr:hypothetical protein [Tsukamurella ocularis]MCS3780003.1 hypothetical protein [Tsukamurella ocularis]MCS3788597.1 hypothetical protein [Tsukamurella ocularis]MCS3849807.1 hypothetical protein [Tsukamurella ocularis]